MFKKFKKNFMLSEALIKRCNYYSTSFNNLATIFAKVFEFKENLGGVR